MTFVWASRHELTEEQKTALTQFDRFVWYDEQNINIDALLEFAENEQADAMGIVCPLPMLQELLAKTTLPILRAKTRREFDADGAKKEFVFDGWEQVLKIEIQTIPYNGKLI